MNKKTTLFGILGLLAISGAGYLYTTGQSTNVAQQVGQYLPESVRGYLPASFSPSNSPVTTQQMEQQENTSDEHSMQQVQIESQQTVMQEPVSEIAEEVAESEAQTGNESNAEVADNELPDNTMIQEIEESIALNDKQELKDASTTSHDQASAKEIMELEMRLKMVKAEINGLDIEKSKLQHKFENVLSKNKELAIKLKTIDDQLKVNMK